ncbi:MAG: polyprenyl synthetase family protein [Treponema sp.]|jgi:octaprenyl-diphosphate synthase|nr:polyprenyl synthetase family protein [Treponema sp.]
MELGLEKRLAKIEAVLDAWLPEQGGGPWQEKVFGAPGGGFAGPKEEASLSGPGRDLVTRGGKRGRPLLMTLVAVGLGGGERALGLVPLVEFPHNASLIHDDIEDNSDERRGGPAVHLIYGNDTAINSGSFLYFLPLCCLASWEAPAERKNRIYEIWGRYMRRLHLGQAMDISWHRDFDSLPGLDEYDRMCRLKTGCLAGLAAVLGVYGAMGASLSPAGEDHAAALLGEAAEHLGVGFQILDDVKNLSTGVPGKKRGDDIVEGKKSLPVLLYLQGPPARRELVKRCFRGARQGGVEVPEVGELIGELESSGALEEARSRGERLIRESRAVFGGQGDVPLNEESRELLARLTDFIS